MIYNISSLFGPLKRHSKKNFLPFLFLWKRINLPFKGIMESVQKKKKQKGNYGVYYISIIQPKKGIYIYKKKKKILK